LTKSEQSRVDFMCTEWSHPYFISIKDFEGLAAGTGVMENVRSEDWAKFTIPSWRHSVWVGVFDPFFWMLRPHLWYVHRQRMGKGKSQTKASVAAAATALISSFIHSFDHLFFSPTVPPVTGSRFCAMPSH